MTRRSLVLPLVLGLVLVAPGGTSTAAGGTAPEAAAPGAPTVPGARECPLFPDSNVWNRPVDRLPVHPRSEVFVRTIGLDTGLHPDFGSYLGYGIPYNVVGADTSKKRVRFDYADESDPGPYPIPQRPRIEGGPSADGDRHILIVHRDECRLYELFAAYPTARGWTAGSGAIWDLRSNRLRPEGWTSGDAAGLPLLPGLVRFDEVAAGMIRHALRFTAPETRREYWYPARHFASDSDDPDLPPMGMRVRLKARFDLSDYTGQARVILAALKRYGMMLGDNGSAWFISGASDRRFDDDDLRQLKSVTGADLEVVDTRGFVNGR